MKSTDIDGRSSFVRERPTTPSELRQRLYHGELFMFAPTDASLRLVDAAQASIDTAFAEAGCARSVHRNMSSDAFFETAGKLRRQFYKTPEFHLLVAELIACMDFEVQQTGFDPARLRIVLPGGHENPAAAAMYYGHRDTWYANPQAMLTWWIPLHDVSVSDSFCFFPDYFDQAVQNDSEIFNFDDWVEEDEKKLIGWQDKTTGLTAQYPQLLEEPRGTRVPVECRRGELLLFSGQHLHRTSKQETDFTRFSLDFRTVDVPDQEQGREARNVDNRSTGSWMKKFLTVADALS